MSDRTVRVDEVWGKYRVWCQAGIGDQLRKFESDLRVGYTAQPDAEQSKAEYTELHNHKQSRRR